MPTLRIALRHLFFVLSLCVFVSPEPASADTPPAGKSLLYVVARDTGQFAKVLVSVNGKLVDQVRRGSYVRVTLDPGQHEVSTAGTSRGVFAVTTSPDSSTYVSLRIDAQGAPQFESLSTANGQRLVAGGQLIREANYSGTAPRGAERTAAREAAPVREPPAAVRSRERTHALGLIFKGGDYDLSDRSQPMGGVASVFDTKSSSVAGFEAEWRHKSGAAVGGEYFRFKNKWTSVGGAFSGSMETHVFALNGKWYFNIADRIFPYVGAGIGAAGADYVGDVTGDAGGTAYQLMGGVEFRFGYVGINIQYKRLNADLDSELSGGTTETNKADGDGLLFGLAVHIPL